MAWEKLEHYRDFGLLVLRLGVGLAYIFLHGWGKLMGGPERWERIGGAMSHFGIDFGHVFFGFMAALSETVGGGLIALGLFFRPACLFLFMTMVVATGSHLGRGDGWRGSAHPLKMAFVFFGFFFVGPGRYSLDELLRRRKRFG